MDQSRSIVIAAAAVSLAASLFAIGAAVSSDDDGSAAPALTTEATTVVPEANAPGDTERPGTQPAAARVDVAIAGVKFNDGEPVTVAVGTEVVWTNNDSTDHSVKFAAATGISTSPDLAQGDTFSFTFTEPGTYQSSCGIHPRMTGTIVVEG